MTTSKYLFPIDIGNNPEPLPDAEHNLDTTSLWTAHVYIGTDLIEAMAKTSSLVSLATLTGRVVGGDSWEQWCESASPGEDLALHVYFTAPDGSRALWQGAVIASYLGVIDPDHWWVSTAGDWAEQLKKT